jgi:hypothetical protein
MQEFRPDVREWAQIDAEIDFPEMGELDVRTQAFSVAAEGDRAGFAATLVARNFLDERLGHIRLLEGIDEAMAEGVEYVFWVFVEECG